MQQPTISVNPLEEAIRIGPVPLAALMSSDPDPWYRHQRAAELRVIRRGEKQW